MYPDGFSCRSRYRCASHALHSHYKTQRVGCESAPHSRWLWWFGHPMRPEPVRFRAPPAGGVGWFVMPSTDNPGDLAGATSRRALACANSALSGGARVIVRDSIGIGPHQVAANGQLPVAANRHARSDSPVGVCGLCRAALSREPCDCWFRRGLVLLALGYPVLGITFLTRSRVRNESYLGSQFLNWPFFAPLIASSPPPASRASANRSNGWRYSRGHTGLPNAVRE